MKMTNHVSFTILTFLNSSWEIDAASNVSFYLKEDKVKHSLPFRYVASFFQPSIFIRPQHAYMQCHYQTLEIWLKVKSETTF